MIALVYAYYENGGMLDHQMSEWASYAPEVQKHFHAIIVDDGSPTDPAAGHVQDVGFPIELFRVKQNIPWNSVGAKNLAMKHAPESFCLVSDIDHVLRPGEARKLVNMDLKRDHFYLPTRFWDDGRPVRVHANTFLLHRDLYWKVGGFDEDFAGWWGGSGPFHAILRVHAKEVQTSEFFMYHYGRHTIPDASTREWGRGRESSYHWSKNLELHAKVHRGPYIAENHIRFEWEKIL